MAGERVTVRHYRIDEEHSNPYAEWVRRGRPLFPQGEEYAAIKARDGLEKLEEDRCMETDKGRLALRFGMPAHGISCLVIEPA